MKTKKDFDCVEMKNSIQKKLLQSTKNMSEAEKVVSSKITNL